MFTKVSLINPLKMFSILLLKPLVLARVSTKKGPMVRISTNSVKLTEFAYYVAEWCLYKETCNKFTQQQQKQTKNPKSLNIFET